MDYSDEVKSLIDSYGITVKMKECLGLINKLVLEGKTLIIWCIFIDSIKKLECELSKRGISVNCINGEIPLDDRQNLINDFKSKKFKVLITNPHTLAESVSLHTVCHDAIDSDLLETMPTSEEELELIFAKLFKKG